MRVLVTGAAGFVGSHLVESLVGAGHDVVGLVRSGSGPRWLVGAGATVKDCGMESPEAMRGAVEHAELIFHVAGVTKAYRAAGYRKGNLDIARNLVEAVHRYGRSVRAVVGVSSQAAGGPHSGPGGVTEIDTDRPVSRYGEAKLAVEEVLRSLGGEVKVGIARPSMVYGPRDTAFVPLYSMARLGLFPVPGSADTAMSIIHVHDLVGGLTRLCDALLDGRARHGGTYYLSGQESSWREIGLAVGRAVGRIPQFIPLPLCLVLAAAAVNQGMGRMGLPTSHLVLDKWREARQSGWVCSHAKAAADFGFEPEVGLDEGMRATVAWCRENGLIR